MDDGEDKKAKMGEAVTHLRCTLAKLSLGEKDVLVVTTPHPLSQKAMEGFTELVCAALQRDVGVIFAGGDVNFSVLKQAPIAGLH